MSITKLPVNYIDGVLDGRRKYVMTNNQDNTVSFEDVSEYIRAELNVSADEFNNVNDTVNDLIDLEEDSADKIETLEDNVTDILSGDAEVANVRNATTADHALNATSATTANHATTAQTATYATTANSATSALLVPNVADEFILINNIQLSFTNRQCVINNAQITETSVVNMYYADANSKANAKAADLTLTPRNGSLLITAVKNPSSISVSIKVKVA